MPIPKFFDFFMPVLNALADGQNHNIKSIRQYAIDIMGISEEEIAKLLPSGKQSVVHNRIQWALSYLKHAGLIVSVSRAVYQITETGQATICNDIIVDLQYLTQFESFRKFHGMESSNPQNTIIGKQYQQQQLETPDDVLEEALEQINKGLADDLLEEALKLSPTAFEHLVIDLMQAMGYGTFENAGKATVATGDEGIDGIIMEDKLGFNLIYIQAKRWNPDHPVGRPDVQAFVGAIAGKGGKGLFVTTSYFTQQAITYAQQQHIILIDGEKLARYMIEHDFGVSVKRTFKIKAIDMDIFVEYQDE